MNLGKCGNCRQSAELHEDPNDGKWVCEDCLTGKDSSVGKGLRQKAEMEIGLAPQHSTPQRDQLLDYITIHADEELIRKLISVKLEKINLELSQENKWIELVEAEPNNRVLLRVATQLGYTPPKPERRVDSVVVPDGKRSKSATKKKRGNGKKVHKRRYTRRKKSGGRLADQSGEPGESVQPEPESE